MIKLKNIHKQYNSFALNISSFQIAKGEKIALIGNNGAGKTTLLNIILDLIDYKGTVLIDNEDNKSEKWKEFTAAFLDAKFLFDMYSVIDFFNLMGIFYGLSKNNIRQELKKYTNFMGKDFEKLLNKKISNLSKGSINKVGIISALITNPKLVILDEPFANLDIKSRHILTTDFEILQNPNTTSIISSHDIEDVLAITNRVIVISDGKIVLDKHNDNSTVQKQNIFELLNN